MHQRIQKVTVGKLGFLLLYKRIITSPLINCLLAPKVTLVTNKVTLNVHYVKPLFFPRALYNLIPLI